MKYVYFLRRQLPGESVLVQMRAGLDTARNFLTRHRWRTISPSEGLQIFPLCPKGSSQTVLHSAHRATTALSWGFCEHKGHLTAPDLPYSPLPHLPIAQTLSDR